MKVVPTIHFFRQCGEAIAVYQKAFPVELLCLLHNKDALASDCAPVPEERKEDVYHCEMLLCGQLVRMCDGLSERPDNAASNCFLAVTFDEPEQVHAAWAALSEGAEVLVPLHSASYSRCMGQLKDRFGVRWGLMVDG